MKEVLAKWGEHAGLVCIFSAMEPCSTYKPWHNKETGKAYLVPDDGKCLHYYFYFIDPELGLSYVRVPTWLPCRLQICFNGHNWLAGQLRKLDIDYQLNGQCLCSDRDWPGPSASPTARRPSDCTGNWKNSPALIGRSFAISPPGTTGARTKVNTPPISSSANRRTCRPSTKIWRARRFTR